MAKNKQKERLNSRDILGKKTLILGEAGTGKTRLVAKLLQELIVLINPEKITIIDLAPKKVSGIGGKITDHVSMPPEVRYLSPTNVYAPRLTGTSPEEILHYAALNKRAMEPLFNKYIQNATEALVVNDVTLYLHAGNLETISKCTRLANTFLATAYYGSRLEKDLGTGISSREKQLTDELAALMNLVVRIGQSTRILSGEL